MYKYYLGAFGNRSFIKPQFEIEDDEKVRIISNRWEEFPNGGTVSLAYTSEKETDAIKDRLVKFKLDVNKNLHPTYAPYESNSNKFQISLDNIVELDREEIVEVISLEYSIDEVLNDKSKRKIKLKHKPNQIVILKDDNNDCYGPFECISTLEEPNYVVTIFINEKVNKYSYADLEQYVYDATYSIKNSDRLQFIYHINKLNLIEPIEQIEYFDDEELANYLKDILDYSQAIKNTAELREDFLDVLNHLSDEEAGKLSEAKIGRISKLLQTSTELSDYKLRIIEEYFKTNPNSYADKEAYLNTHEELIEDIVREDLRYEEKKQELADELEKKNEEKLVLEREIADGHQKLSNQQAELKKLEEQAVKAKQKELESLVASKQDELRRIEKEIEKANAEYTQIDNTRDLFKRDVKKLKEERDSISNDINTKIIQWAATNRSSEIVNLLVSQMSAVDLQVERVIKRVENLSTDKNCEEICSIIYKTLTEAGRSVSKDDVYNYLISVTQNYITVFAGEPGTGKTSLCILLAKALGLYNARFAKILVERGWTSSKDLIGYYNPLTKEIEKTQPAFSNCLETLNEENMHGMVEAPYFVLLDEANLSPIEFYWSHFNHYYDSPNQQIVEYSNGERYCFGKEIKFLATINYDQTTVDLSPRFLDRAWVISMNPISTESIVGVLTNDNDIKNNEEVIALNTLNQLFGWEHFKDKKMNQITKTRIERIVAKMREGGHTISARSLQAINRYYLVAEEYMSSKELALDYAISQKILPLLSGNGKAYGEFLNSLLSLCKENQLSKSANILAKIIEHSEHGYYSFFAS